MTDEQRFPTRAERLEQCKRGFHFFSPPRGRDGMRWCYGCGKTVDPDVFFAEAVALLIQEARDEPEDGAA